MHNYYSKTSSPILPAYGKYIQDLVNHILTIKDKASRTQYAQALVSLIQRIHTTARRRPTNLAKIWHDLWVISSYQLDIDSPYPQPKKTVLQTPQPLAYNLYKTSKYAQYYGYNITNCLSKLADLKDITTQEQLLIRIVRLMSRMHKKTNNLDVILEHIRAITGEKLAGHFASIKKKVKL